MEDSLKALFPAASPCLKTCSFRSVQSSAWLRSAAFSPEISDSAELHIAHAWESVTENMIRVFGSELSESAAATNIDRGSVTTAFDLDS
ncbi:MAG TPA: hypothetical protein PLY75_06625 [Gammaproteobacteria bacterium]|nr:hypothetical protein [Gammaproteobacteria bacterium]